MKIRGVLFRSNRIKVKAVNESAEKYTKEEKEKNGDPVPATNRIVQKTREKRKEEQCIHHQRKSPVPAIIVAFTCGRKNCVALTNSAETGGIGAAAAGM